MVKKQKYQKQKQKQYQVVNIKIGDTTAFKDSIKELIGLKEAKMNDHNTPQTLKSFLTKLKITNADEDILKLIKDVNTNKLKCNELFLTYHQ